MRYNNKIHRALRLLLTVVITTVSATLWAQQAVVSGGNYHKGTTGSISWSLGETAISTLKAGEYIITQGVQQSKLTVKAIDDETGIPTKVTAYPNPTSDYLYIEVDGDIENLWYEVYTVNGLYIAGSLFEKNPQRVDFNKFNSGVYVIKVRHNSNKIKSFRIVKN